MNRGILLLLIAMTLTPSVDALTKVMAETQTPFQVSFLRYFSAGCIALLVARMTGVPVHIPRAGRIGQAMRTAILVAAMTCLVFALSMVPLAYAVGGFLIAPIVATILGAVFLKEQLTLQRVMGAGLAFMGAIMICEPTISLQIGTIFALGGGVLLGIYLVATRGAKDAGHPLATLAFQSLLGSAMIAPFAFYSGPPVISMDAVLMTICLGTLAATTHLTTIAAFERADAGVLAPFLYFNLLAALVIGAVVFGEIPSAAAMVGLVAIAGGGIVSALRPMTIPSLRFRSKAIHEPRVLKVR